MKHKILAALSIIYIYIYGSNAHGMGITGQHKF